ncbi:MAG: aminotransferase class I/II-fold pyridoxal phosphate-dependent enzyme [Gammaproteobacteria bacterium]|nr:aminotransferase class I/II-fold pyridoxal phosphate-dependent enzyme [Gammaproteobacteria bacterium]
MTDRRNRLFGLSGSAKEQLIQQVLKRRGNRQTGVDRKTADTPQKRRVPDGDVRVPEAFTRFDKFPAYQQLKVHKVAAERLKLANPFFKRHEGVAGSTTVIDGREYINYSSYNYLGLCGHPLVDAAAKQAIDRYGTSVSASRIVAGERPIQQELERELASFHGVEDSVVFVSGHATNVTTIGYLFGPKDLVLHDSLIHNSVIQGIQLSGAHRMSFAHNDWQSLDDILSRNRGDFERVLIVVEGIYSMDGDYPELDRFVQVKQAHKAFLMVDEAHSTGVLGARGLGIAEQFGIDGQDVDIWMGTLSKTLASSGGYIAGETALVEHLRIAAPGFLYSVGISPPQAAAALAALRVLKAEPDRVETLRQRGSLFLHLAKQRGIDTGLSAGYSVIPVLTGSSIKAAKLSNALFERGINAQPIVYPAVEEGMARLRFFISSTHTEDQIRSTVNILAEELDDL